MPNTPSGEADNLDDLYAEAERDIRAALAEDSDDMSDQAAAELASLLDRIDEVTAAIQAKTLPD